MNILNISKYLITFSVTFCLTYYLIIYTKDNEQLKIRLDEQVKRFKSEKLDSLIFRMDSLTDFEWEKLYVLADNHAIADSEKIGFSWTCSISELGGVPYLENYSDFIFIFTKNDKVVSYALYDYNWTRKRSTELCFRDKVGLFNIGINVYYTPETAIFKIRNVKDFSGVGGRKMPEIVEAIPQKPNVQYYIDRMKKTE